MLSALGAAGLATVLLAAEAGTPNSDPAVTCRLTGDELGAVKCVMIYAIMHLLTYHVADIAGWLSRIFVSRQRQVDVIARWHEDVRIIVEFEGGSVACKSMAFLS